MDKLDLARWQFAITTVYHFLFVPITIGLSAIVAWYHSRWVRRHEPDDLRLAKFFGKLFTVNFALGLVTGIVQEFQFGMNWSDYSRFVGDIFGAPLAIEALLAFFLESTFLGLWIFGWGRIPERLHAATMWIVHLGTVLSAYFILTANSFMQNPVGFRFNPETKRAELTDFVAVLTNKVQLVTFPHVLAASYLVGGGVVMAVSLWHLHRSPDGEDAGTHRRATRLGAWVTLVSGAALALTGDIQGKIMTEVQPMKMAAAEALYRSSDGHAPFSLLTIGTLDGSRERFAVTVPGLLSFLATGSFDGKVQGIDELKTEYLQRYGGGGLTGVADYAPNIPLAYWSFRLMIGIGMASVLVALALLWLTRRGGTPRGRWWPRLAIALPLLPVLGNSFGWIFTETGRQPWAVFGLMTTDKAVSPSVPAVQVLLSLVVFTLLYGVLAVIEVRLFLRYAKPGPEPFAPPPPVDNDDHPDGAEDDDRVLAFAY